MWSGENPMSKIIFLDCDGVLNSEEVAFKIRIEGINSNGYGGFFQEPTEPTHANVCFGQELVDNLKEIVEKTGAKIVISSTWRVTHRWQTFPKMLAIYGFDNAEVIGATPKLPTKRGYEIQQWLKEHPEVTNYVILDDDNDMLKEQSANFVKTSMYRGLSKEDAEKAIKILNGEV